VVFVVYPSLTPLRIGMAFMLFYVIGVKVLHKVIALRPISDA
jgi:hypothetical protein